MWKMKSRPEHSARNGDNGIEESALQLQAAYDAHGRTVASIRSRIADMRAATLTPVELPAAMLCEALRQHLVTHDCDECRRLLAELV